MVGEYGPRFYYLVKHDLDWQFVSAQFPYSIEQEKSVIKCNNSYELYRGYLGFFGERSKFISSSGHHRTKKKTKYSWAPL